MVHLLVIFFAMVLFPAKTAQSQSVGPSRGMLLRQLELSQKTNAAKPATAVTPSATPTSSAKGRPPLPTIPAKSPSLTKEQAVLYDTLVSLAPKLKDPAQFSTASKRVLSIVNPPAIGSDPRKIIAQSGDLQKALLAVTLNTPSKSALQAAAAKGTISQAQCDQAIKDGRELLSQINVTQWSKLGIDPKGDLAGQELNAQDEYDDYNDQPLSPTEEATVKELKSAGAAASQKFSPLAVITGTAGAAGVFGALVAAYKKFKDSGDLAAKNSVARNALADVITEIAPQNIDTVSGSLKKEVAKALSDGEEALQRTLNPVIADGVEVVTDALVADAYDKEAPLTKLKNLSAGLTEGLYAKGAGSFSVGNNDMNPGLKLSPAIVQALVDVYFVPLTDLLVKAIREKDVSIVIPSTESLLLPLLWIPEKFFADLKTLFDANAMPDAAKKETVVSLINLYTLLAQNSFAFGIGQAYGTNTPVSLVKSCQSLFAPPAQETALYESLILALGQTKATLARLAESSGAKPAGLAFTPLDPQGNPITYSSVVASLKDLPNAATMAPNEVYFITIQKLVSLLTANQDVIVKTERLYTPLLSGTTTIEEDDLSMRMMKTLSADQKSATSAFFNIKQTIRAKVQAATGKVFKTIIQAVAENDILSNVWLVLASMYKVDGHETEPYQIPFALTAPLTLRPKLCESNDAMQALVAHIDRLNGLLADAANRPDISTTLNESAVVRSQLYGDALLNIAEDFFVQARGIDSAKIRYALSFEGYTLADKLIALEQDAASEVIAPLKRLRELFKSVACSDKEAPILQALQSATAQMLAIAKGLASTTPSSPECAGLVAQYGSNLATLSGLLKDSSTRTMIGLNAFARVTIFPDTGFFIASVPVNLDQVTLTAFVDFVKSVKGNPNDLGISGTPNKDAIMATLQQLISAAQAQLAAAAEALPKPVQALSALLAATYPNLKNDATYSSALVTIYSQLKSEENQKIIAENKDIYNVLFSPSGMFTVPPSFDLSKPQSTKVDPITVAAGVALFNYVKDNAKDLNCKGDPLVQELVTKMITFFTVIQRGSIAAPDAPPAEAAAKEATLASAQQAVEKQSDAAASATTTAASKSSAATAEFLKFLQQTGSDLTNKTNMGSFLEAVQKQIDSASKRRAIGQNAELCALFFSAHGIIPPKESFPAYILADDVELGLTVYNKIRSNIADFLPKAKDKTVAAAMIEVRGLDAIITMLAELKKRIDSPDDNYEDVASYQYVTTNPKTGSNLGYVTLKMMTGISDPTQALGPRISEKSLVEHDWTTRQIDIYNYIYESGFTDIRSPSMAIFMKAITKFDSLCKLLDQNTATAGFKYGKLSAAVSMRRLMGKAPLSDAFNAAVLGLETIPVEAGKSPTDVAKAIMFYTFLQGNDKKFNLKAEQQADINNILGWLKAGKGPKLADVALTDSVSDPAMAALADQAITNPYGMGGMGYNPAAGYLAGAAFSSARGANATQGAMNGMANPMMNGMMSMPGMYNPAAGMLMGSSANMYGGMMSGGMGMGYGRSQYGMPGMVPGMNSQGGGGGDSIALAKLQQQMSDLQQNQQTATLLAAIQSRGGTSTDGGASLALSLNKPAPAPIEAPVVPTPAAIEDEGDDESSSSTLGAADYTVVMTKKGDIGSATVKVDAQRRSIKTYFDKPKCNNLKKSNTFGSYCLGAYTILFQDKQAVPSVSGKPGFFAKKQKGIELIGKSTELYNLVFGSTSGTGLLIDTSNIPSDLDMESLKNGLKLYTKIKSTNDLSGLNGDSVAMVAVNAIISALKQQSRVATTQLASGSGATARASFAKQSPVPSPDNLTEFFQDPARSSLFEKDSTAVYCDEAYNLLFKSNNGATGVQLMQQDPTLKTLVFDNSGATGLLVGTEMIPQDLDATALKSALKLYNTLLSKTKSIGLSPANNVRLKGLVKTLTNQQTQLSADTSADDSQGIASPTPVDQALDSTAVDDEESQGNIKTSKGISPRAIPAISRSNGFANVVRVISTDGNGGDQ